MVNTNEIRKLLIDMDMSVKDLAHIMEQSYANVLLKIKNERRMNLDDAEKIQEILGIDDKDFGYYFFCHSRSL